MTKQEIWSRISVNQRWLERAILAIDSRQTADEQSSEQTLHDNGRGWSGADARFGSYLARFIRSSRKSEGERLSGKFVEAGRRLIRKYCGQLEKIAVASQAA